jgi:hypothetical protein
LRGPDNKKKRRRWSRTELRIAEDGPEQAFRREGDETELALRIEEDKPEQAFRREGDEAELALRKEEDGEEQAFRREGDGADRLWGVGWQAKEYRRWNRIGYEGHANKQKRSRWKRTGLGGWITRRR